MFAAMEPGRRDREQEPGDELNCDDFDTQAAMEPGRRDREQLPLPMKWCGAACSRNGARST